MNFNIRQKKIAKIRHTPSPNNHNINYHEVHEQCYELDDRRSYKFIKI